MEDLISACRKHVVAATGPSPFKVGDNQRPERTMSGVVRGLAESSVPVGGWSWRGNPAGMNCWKSSKMLKKVALVMVLVMAALVLISIVVLMASLL